MTFPDWDSPLWTQRGGVVSATPGGKVLILADVALVLPEVNCNFCFTVYRQEVF